MRPTLALLLIAALALAGCTNEADESADGTDQGTGGGGSEVHGDVVAVDNSSGDDSTNSSSDNSTNDTNMTG